MRETECGRDNEGGCGFTKASSPMILCWCASNGDLWLAPPPASCSVSEDPSLHIYQSITTLWHLHQSYPEVLPTGHPSIRDTYQSRTRNRGSRRSRVPSFSEPSLVSELEVDGYWKRSGGLGKGTPVVLASVGTDPDFRALWQAWIHKIHNGIPVHLGTENPLDHPRS